MGKRGKPTAGFSLSGQRPRDMRLRPVLARIADLQVLGPRRDLAHLPTSLF